jgi:hypothetical protein
VDAHRSIIGCVLFGAVGSRQLNVRAIQRVSPSRPQLAQAIAITLENGEEPPVTPISLWTGYDLLVEFSAPNASSRIRSSARA